MLNINYSDKNFSSGIAFMKKSQIEKNAAPTL
jgi:hypothetical protein